MTVVIRELIEYHDTAPGSPKYKVGFVSGGFFVIAAYEAFAFFGQGLNIFNSPRRP
jgi:hypothetical protein